MSQPPSTPTPESYPPPQQQPGGYPQQPNPQAGQPGFGAPAAPPQKKSKVGKILLIVLAVLVVLCAGGGTAIYFALKDTVKEVVDATKTRLVEPETLGGRPKLTDPEFQSIVDEMKSEMRSEVKGATSIIGGLYGDPANEDLVMIIGVSGVMADPKQELEDATGLASELGVKELKTVEAGPLGGEARCGDGKDDDGDPVAACAWADRGSLGMIIMYFKSTAELQPQFVAMRGEIEKKD